MGMHFDNTYARLPSRFYARLEPQPVRAPGLIRVNPALARYLGIEPEWLASEGGVEVLAGNRVPSVAEPLAMAYAGHQFGNWVPQLGDGRALLLGEVIASDGRRYDIQLKGSGRTPFSRGGDGRAPLGPVLREYVVSEAMHALGVPTTRSLGAVSTGEAVYRDGPQPGAVLARVAASHIRIGTFQYFAARQDVDGLHLLCDHVIGRHYPELREADNPPQALLQAVIDRQAELVARWQALGFIHGVMNTDNMLLSGETIDYGPCAFMDEYHPATVFSSIDVQGRYAYSQQPGIAHWNLTCLAQALLPVLADQPETALAMAQEAVDTFPHRFRVSYRVHMLDKLGITARREDDDSLLEELFESMAAAKLDFTLTFRRLAELAADTAADTVEELVQLSPGLDSWLPRWQQRMSEQPTDATQRQHRMLASNPVFIPRNHLVEATIRAAEDEGDFQPFHRLVDRVVAPFEYDRDDAVLATPPSPQQRVHQTFCGT
jgi:uncharacterized protein YdiU (UPF0061 family)